MTNQRAPQLSPAVTGTGYLDGNTANRPTITDPTTIPPPLPSPGELSCGWTPMARYSQDLTEAGIRWRAGQLKGSRSGMALRPGRTHPFATQTTSRRRAAMKFDKSATVKMWSKLPIPRARPIYGGSHTNGRRSTIAGDSDADPRPAQPDTYTLNGWASTNLPCIARAICPGGAPVRFSYRTTPTQRSQDAGLQAGICRAARR